MMNEYVLRSEANAALEKATGERDLLRESTNALTEELRMAHARADAADSKVDGHAQREREAVAALAEERRSRAEEVDGKLSDHLAPIRMALQSIKETKHGIDPSVFDGLHAKIDALGARMDKVAAAPLAQFELEHVRDVGDRITRTRVRQTQ